MKKKITVFIYHISMALLAVCNSIFLCYNINNWYVNINETSILLTFIGFFFTFAGLYVYSIFNTNVEKEKEEIRELKNKYEKELINANKGILSVRKLVNFYQIGQLIVNSSKMNIHIFAWIHDMQYLYKDLIDYMRELYQRGLPMYDDHRADLLSVCRGLSQSVFIMIERIKEHEDDFFAGSKLTRNDKNKLIDELNNLHRLLTENIFVTDNPELHPIAIQKDKSFVKRLKRAWKELIGDSQ